MTSKFISRFPHKINLGEESLSRVTSKLVQLFVGRKNFIAYFSQLTTTMTSTDKKETCTTGSNTLLDAGSVYNAQSAVLRYTPGEERFQLKLVHKNRVFNFDRNVSDSVQVLIDRIVSNISKKQKTWDGVADLILQRGEKIDEIPDKTITTDKLLKDIVNNEQQLNIKISENIYAVVVNPPEIHSIKFLKQVISGLPILPYKIETSTNFIRDASKYSWEFTRDAVTIPTKKNKNQAKKVKDEKSKWEETGCSEFVFTAPEELVGARLRFTCFPSDGKCFGLPFSEELPDTVSSFPVSNPLYLERLGRMNGQSKNMKENLNFFRVVSYNCLAECYATEEWFISSPKTALPADFRLPFLCKEFSSYDADVYCLQEVEDKCFERIFTPFFELTMGYKGFLSSKTGNVKEGVAMYYDPRKLKPIQIESLVISEHMKTMPIWNKIPSSVSERVQDRNSVLQVAIFEPIGQPKTIVIISNTHLYFHPDADHIRLLQTITCVDYIETVCAEIKKNFPDFRVAVISCGDFNCTPPFSSFRYLTTGKVETDDFDWTSHPTEKLEAGLSLSHSLQLSNSHPEHELTNITTCFEGCIDYILYQAEHFELLSTYPPPSKEIIAAICELPEPRLVSLPNHHAPSDHLPLISEFLLKSV